MQAYHNSFYAMGTRLNAVFAFDDENICDSAFQLINTEVLRIERRLNYFDPVSDLSQINENCGKKCIRIDDELYSIFKTCIEYSIMTNGAFDITASSIRGVSSFSEYKYKRPLEKVILNEDNKTIVFSDENVKIDLGGFGKGYALECIKTILQSTPVKNGLISFGGSSIFAFGKHPAGSDWKIGINDLFQTEKMAVEFELSDKSLSVSGNHYVNDKQHLINKKHIVNPHTGSFNDEIKIVVVCSDSPLQAEILSTAFMNMEEREIEFTLNHFENVNVTTIEYNNHEQIIKQL